MEASPKPAGRISVGEVVRETFSIYRDHALTLIGSTVAVLAVIGLVSGLLESTGGVVLVLLGAAVRLAGYAVYAGFVVRLVEDVRDGRRDQTIGDLFSSAAPAILPLIAFAILFGIGVTIGLILLVVPGLILLTFWSVGAPAIVIEDVGPIEAFGRSWHLVRGDAWPVFGTLVVIMLIVVAIGVVLGVIAAAIGDGATVVASIVSNVITAPIFALAVSVMFFDLGGGRAAGAPASSTEPPTPTEPVA